MRMAATMSLSKGKTVYQPVKPVRFQIGNCVVAVAPTNPHRGEEGVVIDVINRGDKIYRYVVRFVDGTTDTLFGFELQLVG